MTSYHNIWKDDKGFIWMLAISLFALISTQLTGGFIWESRFIVRVGFFLFTVIAIKSSSLSETGKSIGYAIASAILLLAVLMIWLETQWLALVYCILGTGYMIFIIMLVINQIFKGGAITVKKIVGGVAAYILLGHLWASLYLTIYILNRDSFQSNGAVIQPVDALKQLSYFSFVTLTTIGYGDITALGSVARVFVMLEGLLGQLFPAIFIAKLVSQQIEDSRKK